MTNRFDPRLIAVFPTETEEEKYRFDLLVRAYVGARYKKNSSITEEYLGYLAERVGRLRGLVEEIWWRRFVGVGLTDDGARARVISLDYSGGWILDTALHLAQVSQSRTSSMRKMLCEIALRKAQGYPLRYLEHFRKVRSCNSLRIMP